MNWVIGTALVGGAAYLYYKRHTADLEDESDGEDASPEPVRLASLSPKRHMEWTLPETKQATAAKIASIFNAPLKQDANASPYIDIVRLAHRVTLTMNGQPVDLSEHAVERLVSALEGSQEIVGNHAMQHVDLFNVLVRIGLESRTMAVLKGLHQGILMPISFALKAYTRLLTKDKDWTIIIVVKGPRATVRHRRVEASFGATDADRFEVETVTTLTLNGTTLEGVDTTMRGLPLSDTLSDLILDEFILLDAWSSA